MELDTPAKVVMAFYRLCGTVSDDGALREQGEALDDVAYTFLTRGCRNAQRFLLKMGWQGWRKRSSALAFSGTDASTGGCYATLPSDFLRACGNAKESALVETNGDPWGQEVSSSDSKVKGNGYYLLGEELWLTRGAAPPTTLFLTYHYVHPLWSSSATIDFPVDAMPLVVAEAANVAKEEAWLPGGQDMEQKIERALMRAREEARDFARPTKQARTFRRPLRIGNHW